MSKAGRIEDKFGIVMFDMDGLKHLNDTFGHKTGDAGIIEIVKRTKKVLRESDIYAGSAAMNSA